ncbi:hypothetical protein [Deinococcus hopiensis]|uniref:Uncharacterized protein n=1 Tax=Deinococcus hopiensis KR-140 TaxID=695939 RepID=A0A1W1V8E4_9DEIO|nr:hypothetical protein [Deinococcus hopiensis]SMB89274.1 hypothetical protein SAMN00790413_00344 [Deinococcus hopiensis KR-140]
MKEKVKRLLDLVRAGRLSLEDAAPLLAALSPRLALTDSDRELIASLLGREDLDTGQVAEHLLLLRGVKDIPVPPQPPRPVQPPRPPRVVVGGRTVGGLDELMDRVTGNIDGFVDHLTGAVEGAFHGGPPWGRPAPGPHFGAGMGTARILNVQVESSAGDEYNANLPVSLAPHLNKLIPAHGQQALERAGLSIEALQLLIESSPPPGELINAEDSAGNSVRISLK